MEAYASFHYYAPFTDTNGERRARIDVVHTYPAGGVVRWRTPDGTLLGEAREGGHVEIPMSLLVTSRLSIDAA